QDLACHGAADAHLQPPGTLNGKIAWREVRTFAARETLKALHACNDRLPFRLLHRLHQSFTPRKKGRARYERLPTQLTDDVGLGRPIVRIRQTSTVSLEKAIP